MKVEVLQLTFLRRYVFVLIECIVYLLYTLSYWGHSACTLLQALSRYVGMSVFFKMAANFGISNAYVHYFLHSLITSLIDFFT